MHTRRWRRPKSRPANNPGEKAAAGPAGPTPVRAAIVNLLADLRDAFGLSYLFIAHDLAVVAQLADRIAVMYRGGLCETGSTSDVLQRLYHPYTQALLASVPQIRADRVSRAGRRVAAIVAAGADDGACCRFRARSPHKISNKDDASL